jgi:hypothetical protein
MAYFFTRVSSFEDGVYFSGFLQAVQVLFFPEKRKPKSATSTRFAFNSNVSSMSIDNTLTDAQAKAYSPDSAGCAHIQLLETYEQLLDVLWCDSNSRILDLDTDLVPFLACSNQDSAPFWSELDRVIHEVA